MSSATILTLLAIVATRTVTCPLIGRYLAATFGDGNAPGDRFFDPVERRLIRLLRAGPEREQRWGAYAASLLAFSAVSVLVLYVLLRRRGVRDERQRLGAQRPQRRRHLWTTSLGLAMLAERFLVLVPAVALGGSFATIARTRDDPAAVDTTSASFTGLLLAVVVIVGLLTYLPALALTALRRHARELAPSWG